MNLWDTLFNIWALLFAWLPSEIVIPIICLIGLVVIICIIKLVAFIMDVIPFV